MAVTATPGPGTVAVYSSARDAGNELNTLISMRAVIGEAQTRVPRAAPDSWDLGAPPAARASASRRSRHAWKSACSAHSPHRWPRSRPPPFPARVSPSRPDAAHGALPPRSAAASPETEGTPAMAPQRAWVQHAPPPRQTPYKPPAPRAPPRSPPPPRPRPGRRGQAPARAPPPHPAAARPPPQSRPGTAAATRPPHPWPPAPPPPRPRPRHQNSGCAGRPVASAGTEARRAPQTSEGINQRFATSSRRQRTAGTSHRRHPGRRSPPSRPCRLRSWCDRQTRPWWPGGLQDGR